MYRKNKNIVRKLKKNVGDDGVELVGEGGLFALPKKAVLIKCYFK